MGSPTDLFTSPKQNRLDPYAYNYDYGTMGMAPTHNEPVTIRLRWAKVRLLPARYDRVYHENFTFRPITFKILDMNLDSF